MEKISKLVVATMIIGISTLIFTSCSKFNQASLPQAETNYEMTVAKSFTPTSIQAASNPVGGSSHVTLWFTVGHPESKCTCKAGHVACQGAGVECKTYSRVAVNGTSGRGVDAELFAVEIDEISSLTLDESFLMPSRSFLMLNEDETETGYYLNVPEQILEKDDNGLFVFRQLSYTETPLYQNN